MPASNPPPLTPVLIGLANLAGAVSAGAQARLA